MRTIIPFSIFTVLIIYFGIPHSLSEPEAQFYPGFSRACKGPVDCHFQPNSSSTYPDKVWLSCEKKVCICENYKYIADVPSWDLKWDGKDCAISETGPCGEENGLTIKCQEGLECIEVKCRNPQKLHSAPLGYTCSDDIDCAEGLVCKQTEFQYGPVLRCVNPEEYESESEKTTQMDEGDNDDHVESESATTISE